MFPYSDETFTAVALPSTMEAPPGWVGGAGHVARIVGIAPGTREWTLERWRYLRRRDGVVRIFRIRDFTGASAQDAVLERIQQAGSHCSLALHLDVLGSSRARRTAERAVHRQRSDVSSVGAAGFRRTASSDQATERLRVREVEVASGHGLLKVAVYVVVRAETLDGLSAPVAELRRLALESGVRLDHGFGRQAQWYRYQLPGGMGW